MDKKITTKQTTPCQTCVQTFHLTLSTESYFTIFCCFSVNSRRCSSSKIPSMSIQAPITRVINLIMQAQENSPHDVAMALDKVRLF